MAKLNIIDMNSIDGLRTVLTDPAVYVISEDVHWHPGQFKMEQISKVDVETIFGGDAIIVRIEK